MEVSAIIAQLRLFLNNPYLLLSLTALMWAGNAIIGRAAPLYVSPAVLTFGRWGIAALVTIILFSGQLRRDTALIKHNGWIPICLGMVGYALFNLFLYQALRFMPATNAAIMQSGIPLLIIVFNFILLRQAARYVEILGFMMSIIGVAIVVTNGNVFTLFERSYDYGELFMFLAAIAYALYTIGLRFKPKMHWQSFLSLAILGAAIMSLFLMALEISVGSAIFPSTYTGWAMIAYAAILPSILAQGFYIRGVESVGPNRAGLFINLVPLFTALLAIFILGEKFHLYHALALILVIGGVSLAQKK